MPLELDKYLIKNFDERYERINDGISQISLYPVEILKQMGVTITRLTFSEPTSYHFHKKTKELFKFERSGKVIFEDIEFRVNKGDILYVPEGKKHKLIPEQIPSEGGSCRYGNLGTFLIALPFFDSSDEFVVKE